MHAVSAGDILILIAEHVSRVALRMIARSPMQIREEERGVETKFVGVGLLRIARMAVAQRPVVSTIALEREGLPSTEEVLDR